MQPLELSTPRLRLTPLTEADAPALFAYRGLPEVMQYQTFTPSSEADAVAFIRRATAEPFGTVGAWCQLGVRALEGGALVGDIGARVSDEGRQAEFGVTIAPTHWRQGYAAEAARAVLDHLFGVVGVHRVHASVDPRNAASMALMQRLGLRQEGLCLQSFWLRGAWVADALFAVLASEWSAREG